MRLLALIIAMVVLLPAAQARGEEGYATESAEIVERMVLHIGTSYSPPLSTENQDGFFDLLLKEAGRRLGLDVEMEMLPAERSLHDANAGLLDGDVGRVKAVASIYENLRRVEEPVLRERNFAAFARGFRFETASWDALAPYHVGYVRGWKIFETHAAAARSLIGVDSTRTLFSMLQKERIQVALSARLDGLAMARELGIEDVVVMEPPLASVEMFLYLNERHEMLCEPFAEALRDMERDGSIRRLKRDMERRYFEF